MKCCQTILLMATLLFASAALRAQDVTDVKVELDVVESPRISADNVSPVSGSGIGEPKWIEISVLYTMPAKADPKTKQMEWVDDMTISASVILYPAQYHGDRVRALLTGKQTLMSVPCDGRKHRATLYVPPVILARYGAADLKLNRSIARDLPALVAFANKQQKNLGYGMQTPRGATDKTTASAFKEAETSLGILKLEDSILPREQTPWAHLDFGTFDMPKPVGSK